MQRNVDFHIAPTTVTQTVTTTRTPHQGYDANRGTAQVHGYASRNTPQEQEYDPRNSAVPQHQEYAPRNNTTPQHQGSTPQKNATPQRQEYDPRNSAVPQYQEYAPRNNTTPQHQGSTPQNNATPQRQQHAPNNLTREYASRNNAGTIRPVNEGNAQGTSMSQPHRGDLSSGPRFNAYGSPNLQGEDDAGLARESSIPRKQIGTSASTTYSSAHSSSTPRAQTGHSRQQSASKPLPSTPATASLGYTDRQTDSASQQSSILNRSRPMSTSQAGIQDAQDVVDRAKSNTSDTQVIETVAPGQYHA